MMKDLPLAKVYQLLEPGPVVLLTTARKGPANVMTMSWHMMVEFEPPLVACVVSSGDHSFAALRATKECVIAIPARHLAPTVVGVGNCSGRDVEKFERFGLTALQAERVAPPLVAECFANLEMQSGQYAVGEQVQSFRSGGGEGLDGSRPEGSQDPAPSGIWQVRRGWRGHPVAIENAVTAARGSVAPMARGGASRPWSRGSMAPAAPEGSGASRLPRQWHGASSWFDPGNIKSTRSLFSRDPCAYSMAHHATRRPVS
jgi:hypothetical protein